MELETNRQILVKNVTEEQVWRKRVCIDIEINNTYVPRAATELIKLAAIGENDESNLSITQYGEFVGLLKESISSLGKCHLPVYFVLYPLQLYSSSSHFILFLSLSYLYSIPLLVKG